MKKKNERVEQEPLLPKEVEVFMAEVSAAYSFLCSAEYDEVPFALQILEGPGGRSLRTFEEMMSRLDPCLNKIVNDYYKCFNFAVKFYSEAADTLQDALSRISLMRKQLEDAKQGLMLRHFDLMALWERSQGYAQMLQIINLVDMLRTSPEKIEGLSKSKNYHEAVCLLLESIRIAESSDCITVTALDDVRRNLFGLKTRIFECIMNDVMNHVYLKSPFTEDKWFTEKKTFTEEQRRQTPEADSVSFISMCLESIFVLRTLDEAMLQLRQRIPMELHNMVEQNLKENVDLGVFLKTIYAKFECVMESHKLIINVVEAISVRENQQHKVYNIQEVWYLMLTEIKQISMIHLFSKSKSNSSSQFEFTKASSTAAIKLYKSRLDFSCVYLFPDAYSFKNKEPYKPILKPDFENIAILYTPTLNLMKNLNFYDFFLNDFITTEYIPYTEQKINQLFSKAVNSPDAFVISDSGVFCSAELCLGLIESLCQTISCVPHEKNSYVIMIKNILSKYFEKCLKSSTFSCFSQEISETYSKVVGTKDEISTFMKLHQQSFLKSQLLFDKKKLSTLALTKVSLEWFSENAKKTLKTKIQVVQVDDDDDDFRLHESSESLDLDSISPILDQFLQFAFQSLSILRCELKCHSAYFVDLAMRDGCYFLDDESLDPEPYILQLNNDIIVFEEICSLYLEKQDSEFVFDGLSNLLAHLLVSNAKYIRLMNKFGARKMIKSIRALHQNLLNIGLCSEMKLENARKYYEMYLMDIKQILYLVQTQKPTYSLQEYVCMMDFMFDVKNLPDLITSDNIEVSALATNAQHKYQNALEKIKSFF